MCWSTWTIRAQVVESLRATLKPDGVLVVLVPQSPRPVRKPRPQPGTQAALHARHRPAAAGTARLHGRDGRTASTRPARRRGGPTARCSARASINKPVLKIFDKTVWFWRRMDGLIPWPGLSLIVVARKTGAGRRAIALPLRGAVGDVVHPMPVEGGRPPERRDGRLCGKRILVIGDLMLDEFIWGKVSRISPEAPVPIVNVTGESYYPGGAANVARNLREFTPQVGGDGNGRDGRPRAAAGGVAGRRAASIPPACSRTASHPTTVKTRIIARNQQVVRVDRERKAPLTDGAGRNAPCGIWTARSTRVDGMWWRITARAF